MSRRDSELAKEIFTLSRVSEAELQAKSNTLMRALAQHTPALHERVERLEDARFWANLPWKEMIWPSVISLVIGSVLTTLYHQFL